MTTGDPPSQQTDIKTATTVETKIIGGSGKFVIPCGYQNDAECQAAFGLEYGVGGNSCCYARPKLVKVYPGTTSTPIKENICPNTFIEATFDKKMDESSLAGNVLIAKGITSETLMRHVTSVPDGTGGAYLKTPVAVTTNGKYLYVLTGGEYSTTGSLEIMDITNPEAPKHISTLFNEELSPGVPDAINGAKLLRPQDVYFYDDYVFIVSAVDNALEIINVSDPKNHAMFTL